MDYLGLTNTAIRQVADKGRLVSLIFVTQGTYSAATDTFTGGSTSTQSVRMVITNYNQSDIDGTLIKHGDKLALLANDSLTRAPERGDQVTDGGITYGVENVEEIKPGDTVLLYKLQLRN